MKFQEIQPKKDGWQYTSSFQTVGFKGKENSVYSRKAANLIH